jgi:hypothetical protein
MTLLILSPIFFKLFHFKTFLFLALLLFFSFSIDTILNQRTSNNREQHSILWGIFYIPISLITILFFLGG